MSSRECPTNRGGSGREDQSSKGETRIVGGSDFGLQASFELRHSPLGFAHGTGGVGTLHHLTGELLKAENVATVKTSLVIRCAKDQPGVPFDVLEARLARTA